MKLKIIEKFNPNKNYIGSNSLHHKFTNLIYKKCSGINRTAYTHDKLYLFFLLSVECCFNFIVLKLFADLIFLIMGLIRSFRKFEFIGLVLVPLFFVCLVLYTPIYVKNNWAR